MSEIKTFRIIVVASYSFSGSKTPQPPDPIRKINGYRVDQRAYGTGTASEADTMGIGW
jgi:hypothetical protein